MKPWKLVTRTNISRDGDSIWNKVQQHTNEIENCFWRRKVVSHLYFKLSFWGDRNYSIDVEHFGGDLLGSFILTVLWNSTVLEGGEKRGPSHTLESIRLDGGRYELGRYDRKWTTNAVVADQRQRKEVSVISDVRSFAIFAMNFETAEPWTWSRWSINISRMALPVILCSSQDIRLIPAQHAFGLRWKIDIPLGPLGHIAMPAREILELWRRIGNTMRQLRRLCDDRPRNIGLCVSRGIYVMLVRGTFWFKMDSSCGTSDLNGKLGSIWTRTVYFSGCSTRWLSSNKFLCFLQSTEERRLCQKDLCKFVQIGNIMSNINWSRACRCSLSKVQFDPLKENILLPFPCGTFKKLEWK